MKNTLFIFLILVFGITSCSNNNSVFKETTESATPSNNQDSKIVTNNGINYETYVNPRFGFSIEYPTFLTPEPESDNGDGRVFSNGKNEKIVVSAQYNILDYSIEELLQMCKNSIDGTITYSAQKSNWFVLSGINQENNIYYWKTILTNGIEYTVCITYPQDRKQIYNEIVNSVTESFRVGLEVTLQE